ncbi:hypothetical protein CCACVL1_00037 [Corchorus capsularis]|uniref:Uncharacterized protein n=1 Tax=Corchorus capsularis TaxID=210143 RepID=A0A1R3KZ85_COCAP|nr:hypothetical protein CCACVL1_00037 [Corchorus capsularis]
MILRTMRVENNDAHGQSAMDLILI